MRGAPTRHLLLILPVVLIGTTGCFATRGDVAILQGDIATVRADMQRADQEQVRQLTEAGRILQAVSDSLSRLSTRQQALEGDVRGGLRNVGEQLIQVQTLLGQSQGIIRSLRAELEASGRSGVLDGVLPPTGAPPAGTPPAGTPPVTTPPPTGSTTPPVTGTGNPPPVTPGGLPGPNQLYQDGMGLMQSGSYASARIAFQDLLLNYPGADVAADAQYWVAESHAAEKNAAAAETAYAAVVSKYPNSAKAPDALYKRALLLIEQGNGTMARPLLEQLVQRYPRSDAAELAKDLLPKLR